MNPLFGAGGLASRASMDASGPRSARQPDRGRILRDHFNGRETHDTLIWSLVVFQTWFDLDVDGIPRATQRAVPAASFCPAEVASPWPWLV
ncbi:MAG TPA: hypothetical protein VGF24_13120 [Vicinamibacterales bacterium]